MITDAKPFGEAICQRRRELGYTQAFLAELSGFSVGFIYLENGKSTAELGHDDSFTETGTSSPDGSAPHFSTTHWESVAGLGYLESAASRNRRRRGGGSGCRLCHKGQSPRPRSCRCRTVRLVVS